MHKYTCTHAHIHTHTLSLSHIHTHTTTHTHTHTTHTHTHHMHTHSLDAGEREEGVEGEEGQIIITRLHSFKTHMPHRWQCSNTGCVCVNRLACSGFWAAHASLSDSTKPSLTMYIKEYYHRFSVANFT